ncbi:DUF3397 family protein [Brevibacillus migulae]|uniref:DUF3397 family protein n=1 Tax=Brevibacillus migulae TaxID=1644114 RepID=UPI00106E465A|nr:DUF3397 family protein [Brevibacillus migulae]
MSFLIDGWVFVWGILATFPFFGFVMIYLAVMLWKRNKRQAANWAINITNFLLIHAVMSQYSLIWPDAWSVWWWIVLLFVGLLFLLGWLQVKVRGKISLKKISFSTWRISFLLLCLAYVCLFTAGVWKTMQLG